MVTSHKQSVQKLYYCRSPSHLAPWENAVAIVPVMVVPSQGHPIRRVGPGMAIKLALSSC